MRMSASGKHVHEDEDMPLTRDIPSSLYAADNRDQVYAYDGLQRLADMDEGTLSGSAIGGTPVSEETWALDALGNWTGFVQKAAGTVTPGATADLFSSGCRGPASHCWRAGSGTSRFFSIF
jgi:hypothetical protein